MMSPLRPRETHRIRRVVAVLDPIGSSDSLLEVAVDLARRLRRPGLALAVRDEVAIGTEGFLLGREVRRIPLSLAERSATGADRLFRVRVRRTAHTLQRLGREDDEPWQLSVEPDVSAERVRRQLGAGDLVVVAEDRWMNDPYRRLSRDLRRIGPHPVLTVPTPASMVTSIQAVVGGDPADEAVLHLTAELAGRLGRPTVHLIATPGGRERADRWMQTATADRSGIPADVFLLRQDRLDLLEAARAGSTRGGLLILPSSVYHRDAGRIEPVLRLLAWPALLVGETGESDIASPGRESDAESPPSSD